MVEPFAVMVIAPSDAHGPSRDDAVYTLPGLSSSAKVPSFSGMPVTFCSLPANGVTVSGTYDPMTVPLLVACTITDCGQSAKPLFCGQRPAYIRYFPSLPSKILPSQ